MVATGSGGKSLGVPKVALDPGFLLRNEAGACPRWPPHAAALAERSKGHSSFSHFTQVACWGAGVSMVTLKDHLLEESGAGEK